MGETIHKPWDFVTGATAAGIKYPGRNDLTALVSRRPAVTAMVATRNLFQGAPVIYNRELLTRVKTTHGTVVNSGISNACTGKPGLRNAARMAALAEAAGGLPPQSLLVASTGVIGWQLPMEKIEAGLARLMPALSEDGWPDFARAIMTTDTVPKLVSARFRAGRGGHSGGPWVRLAGVAKGSGMIRPNMATMLSYIATDYPLGAGAARKLLRGTADRTFNCVTVDGDTSTSDTLALFANGAALGRRELHDAAAADAKFEAALNEVALELTRMIAADGEGATKLVMIEVEGAASDADARRIGQSVGNSCLVKTAIFGNDPNWGRICCAAGYAGVAFDPNEFSLTLQGVPVMRRGLPVAFDAKALSAALKTDAVVAKLKVGSGKGRARIYTCDFSYDYVRINAEYTT
jgi:glutamate N-acetyltransferase/amino-acid N-acetyltransferase